MKQNEREFGTLQWDPSPAQSGPAGLEKYSVHSIRRLRVPLVTCTMKRYVSSFDVRHRPGLSCS